MKKRSKIGSPAVIECINQDRIALIGQLTTLDKIEVDEKYPDIDEAERIAKDKNVKQIDNGLRHLLHKLRDGLIKHESTPKAYKRGLVGGGNSSQGKRRQVSSAKHNAINNPKWNPINKSITNAKWNPINNPKNRRKKQDEL